MDWLMKWTLFFATLMMAFDSGHAWNIGSKGHALGPTIHTTYFLTPNNAAFPVHAQMCVGMFANGHCLCRNDMYDLGTETLKTGDTFDIDGFALNAIMGSGYSCMTISYTLKQNVAETFQIHFNGINYDTSLPPRSEVNVL